MSQIVKVDSRLPDPNDPVIFATMKNLIETKAQAQEDAKNDLKRPETFSNQTNNEKKHNEKNINLKIYIRLFVFFLLAFSFGMIVRNFKIPKIIKYGLAGIFVYILLNQIHKLQ